MGFSDMQVTDKPLNANFDYGAKTGDVWALGHHRLLCGDSTIQSNFDKVLTDQKADMVICDPPYNVNYKHCMMGDNQGPLFAQFLEIVCKHLVNYTNGAIYISMAASAMFELRKAFENAGGHWSTFIIWAKNHFAISRGDYHRQFEPMLYGWPKDVKRFWCGDRTQSDLWFIKKPAKNKLHPTMKPIELIERAILNSSQEGDLILDPFGGSGSTLIACERNNRRCCMIEIDPHYVDVIIKRFEQETSVKAIRETL